MYTKGNDKLNKLTEKWVCPTKLDRGTLQMTCKANQQVAGMFAMETLGSSSKFLPNRVIV